MFQAVNKASAIGKKMAAANGISTIKRKPYTLNWSNKKCNSRARFYPLKASIDVEMKDLY